MKKSPLDVARDQAAALREQITAGIARGKLIGDRNVYFTDSEVEEMAASAIHLMDFLETVDEPQVGKGG